MLVQYNLIKSSQKLTAKSITDKWCIFLKMSWKIFPIPDPITQTSYIHNIPYPTHPRSQTCHISNISHPGHPSSKYPTSQNIPYSKYPTWNGIFDFTVSNKLLVWIKIELSWWILIKGTWSRIFVLGCRNIFMDFLEAVFHTFCQDCRTFCLVSWSTKVFLGIFVTNNDALQCSYSVGSLN